MDTKSMSIAVIAAMDSTTTTALGTTTGSWPVDHEIDIRAVLCDGLLGLCDRRGSV